MSKDVIDEILEEEEEEEVKTEAQIELEKKVEELEKKNMGLLNETKAQRRKRQEVEQRLDKLTGTVEGILTNRVTGSEQTPVVEAPKKIVLEYDEDGNPVLDTSVLGNGSTAQVKALEDKIANLEALLQATSMERETASQAERVIQAIVGEDERYGTAYSKYQNARKWVEDRVVEFQNEHNLDGQMTSGQALDHVFDEDLENEFKSKFPNIDLERVVTAEDSQRHFRNTLAAIADASSPDSSREGERMKRVLGKPSSLGTNKNAKGASLGMDERLANISTEDILGLSDAQAAQLEKALARLG